MTRCLLAMFFAAALWAADYSGKWAGSIDVRDPSSGSTVSTSVRVELQQKDKALTGTIGRGEDESSQAIQNGIVDGSTVSFEVDSAEAPGIMKFSLKGEGDLLQGEMKGSGDASDIVGIVKLKRQ
jgi:hypothetical protein